jgi:phenylalanyl-tRNA synthetase beta chain
MPTVSVSRTLLFNALGKVYNDKEFMELCFTFGIELDDVTTEKVMVGKSVGDKNVKVTEEDVIIYKIDVSANRYDILCLEGLSQALNVFIGRQQPPEYILTNPTPSLCMNVTNATASVRPFVVCAILRDIEFTDDSYKSFIDLQDKLHQNIARGRTLVAIGMILIIIIILFIYNY